LQEQHFAADQLFGFAADILACRTIPRLFSWQPACYLEQGALPMALVAPWLQQRKVFLLVTFEIP
jgi:hypothetical protein